MPEVRCSCLCTKRELLKPRCPTPRCSFSAREKHEYQYDAVTADSWCRIIIIIMMILIIMFRTTTFAYHLDDDCNSAQLYVGAYNVFGRVYHTITWPGRGTLMDLFPRGRIQHMLTQPKTTSAVHTTLLTFPPSIMIFSRFFLLYFYFFFRCCCYFHFMFTTSLARIGPDNIICYSARLGRMWCAHRVVVSGGFLSRAT
jgi:hypothetical protein